jgi:cytochrome c biogenesis protein CcdA
LSGNPRSGNAAKHYAEYDVHPHPVFIVERLCGDELVTDVLRAALENPVTHPVLAPALSFAAGLATSFGPCIAPRFVAIAGLAANARGAARWLRVAAFVVGLCTSYVLLGSIAGALGMLAAYSSYVYGALGLGLVVAGVGTLVRMPHSPACAAAPHRPSVSQGATFATGFALSAVSSPCCGPIAAALAGTSLASGNAAFGGAMLAAFAFGHAVPLVAVACGSMRVGAFLAARSATPALSTVGGALMVALGTYYGLLA